MVPSLHTIATAVCCALSLATAAVAQPDAAGLGAVVRALVVESLNGGGRRHDQVLVAADSGTATLLRLADLSTVTDPGPAGLVCPGSTGADAQPVPSTVGYVVRVVLSAGTDSTTRQIHVSKGCDFRYRGGGRRFEETGTWELRRRGVSWYVVRLLESSVT